MVDLPSCLLPTTNITQLTWLRLLQGRAAPARLGCGVKCIVCSTGQLIDNTSISLAGCGYATKYTDQLSWVPKDTLRKCSVLYLSIPFGVCLVQPKWSRSCHRRRKGPQLVFILFPNLSEYMYIMYPGCTQAVPGCCCGQPKDDPVLQ